MRDLDGVKILAEEKIKAENLHGLDQNDKELIFQSLLPEEKYVDRRINVVDDIPLESESEAEQISFIEQRYDANGGLCKCTHLTNNYSGCFTRHELSRQRSAQGDSQWKPQYAFKTLPPSYSSTVP